MFKDNRFEQQGDEGSTNIQAVNYYGGLSYNDAKDIALDVFESNFFKLSSVAAEVARERAENMVEDFLTKLLHEEPDALINVTDPDVQYAIFSAQKEYARSGDENVGKMLVDLLVARTKVRERSFRQIVLNESIEILPKLNSTQLSILTLIFLLTNVKFISVDSLSTLKDTLLNRFEPYILDPSTSDNHFLHLEYCGCINTERIASREITATFKINYPGLFSKGFTQEFLTENLPFALASDISNETIRECLHDSSLLQFNALDNATLENIIKKHSSDVALLSQTLKLFNENSMSENQIMEKLIELSPNFENLNSFWSQTAIKSARLTTVGIAIAHANLIKDGNLNGDLEIWIN